MGGAGFLDPTVYDSTSILKFIERLHGLPTLASVNHRFDVATPTGGNTRRPVWMPALPAPPAPPRDDRGDLGDLFNAFTSSPRDPSPPRPAHRRRRSSTGRANPNARPAGSRSVG